MEFVPFKYEKEEEKAFECFEKFAKHHSKSFRDYEHTESGVFYDVSATSRNGLKENIELKLRREGADSYSGCFIEPSKWHNLLTDWRENGILPIYINFVGGPDNVYVWELQKVKGGQWKPNVIIDGEERDRIDLDWKEANHYVYDYEINKYKIKYN